MRYDNHGNSKASWPKHDTAAETIRHGGSASEVARIAKHIAAGINARLDNITVIPARDVPA